MSPRAFAHLLPAEAIIWTRFLRQHGSEWDRYEYDVRVGEGRPLDPSWPPEIQRMATHLSQKRIDAIGWRGTHPTLFEVTPRGSRTAYGALQLYARLYRETFAHTGPLALALITIRIDPDILRVMEQDGMRVFLLPPIPGE